ncbi:MAG: hypothetical protein ACKOSS_02985 [Planctomycetia bacterium]
MARTHRPAGTSWAAWAAWSVMLVGLGVAALAMLGVLGSGAPAPDADLHGNPHLVGPRTPPAHAPAAGAHATGGAPGEAGREPDAPADDPNWPSRIFVVPAGTGPVTGAELLAALEASGSWRFTAGEAALLEEVRAHAFEQAERGSEQPYAALAGWLKDAGYLLEQAWPQLRIVRRPDGPAAAR